MSLQTAVQDLVKSCTVYVEAGGGAGTAFFVAPGYAITASHVVSGMKGIDVQLQRHSSKWTGRVLDARPAFTDDSPPPIGGLYPPPDIALVHIEKGPAHPCVLLGTRELEAGSPVMAYGHSHNQGEGTATAESEQLTLSGERETVTPGLSYLKLGLGHAGMGMSGGPVLSLRTGEVIGMVKASRDIQSNLGALIVPAAVIRNAWPVATVIEHDKFHDANTRLRWLSRKLSESQRATSQPAEQADKLAIGSIHAGGPVMVVSGSHFRDIIVNNARRPGNSGRKVDGQQTDG